MRDSLGLIYTGCVVENLTAALDEAKQATASLHGAHGVWARDIEAQIFDLLADALRLESQLGGIIEHTMSDDDIELIEYYGPSEDIDKWAELENPHRLPILHEYRRFSSDDATPEGWLLYVPDPAQAKVSEWFRYVPNPAGSFNEARESALEYLRNRDE